MTLMKMLKDVSFDQDEYYVSLKKRHGDSAIMMGMESACSMLERMKKITIKGYSKEEAEFVLAPKLERIAKEFEYMVEPYKRQLERVYEGVKTEITTEMAFMHEMKRREERMKRLDLEPLYHSAYSEAISYFIDPISPFQNTLNPNFDEGRFNGMPWGIDSIQFFRQPSLAIGHESLILAEEFEINLWEPFFRMAELGIDAKFISILNKDGATQTYIYGCIPSDYPFFHYQWVHGRREITLHNSRNGPEYCWGENLKQNVPQK